MFWSKKIRKLKRANNDLNRKICWILLDISILRTNIERLRQDINLMCENKEVDLKKKS